MTNRPFSACPTEGLAAAGHKAPIAVHTWTWSCEGWPWCSISIRRTELQHHHHHHQSTQRAEENMKQRVLILVNLGMFKLLLTRPLMLSFSFSLNHDELISISRRRASSLQSQALGLATVRNLDSNRRKKEEVGRSKWPLAFFCVWVGNFVFPKCQAAVQ